MSGNRDGRSTVDVDSTLKVLAEVRSAAHDAYPDNPGRLAQLDTALDTARMAVEHLADEDIRHKHNPKAHAKALGTYVSED